LDHFHTKPQKKKARDLWTQLGREEIGGQRNPKGCKEERRQPHGLIGGGALDLPTTTKTGDPEKNAGPMETTRHDKRKIFG